MLSDSVISSDWTDRLLAMGSSPEDCVRHIRAAPFDTYAARDAHGRSLLMLACRADPRCGLIVNEVLKLPAWRHAPSDSLIVQCDAKGRSLALYLLSVQTFSLVATAGWLEERSPRGAPQDATPGFIAQGSWGASAAVAAELSLQPPHGASWRPSAMSLSDQSALWVPLTHYPTWNAVPSVQDKGLSLAWAHPDWWWGTQARLATQTPWHQALVPGLPVDPQLLDLLCAWASPGGASWADLFHEVLSQWEVPASADPHWGLVEDMLYHITTGAPLEEGRPEWEALWRAPGVIVEKLDALLRLQYREGFDGFGLAWRQRVSPRVKATHQARELEMEIPCAVSRGKEHRL